MLQILPQLLYTAEQVHKLEDEVNTIYQVLTYALPLLIGVITAYGIAYRTVIKRVKSNSAAINSIASATNGRMTQLESKVDDIHSSLITREVDRSNDGTSQSTSGADTSTATGSGTGPLSP